VLNTGIVDINIMIPIGIGSFAYILTNNNKTECTCIHSETFGFEILNFKIEINFNKIYLSLGCELFY
jgi:F0F1-type ATP synthase alpha subunit